MTMMRQGSGAGLQSGLSLVRIADRLLQRRQRRLLRSLLRNRSETPSNYFARTHFLTQSITGVPDPHPLRSHKELRKGLRIGQLQC